VIGGCRLEALLGQGGAGRVYRATHLELERQVAVKLVHVAEPRVRARFEREGQAAAKVVHPHVARIFDRGDEGGVSFLVQELVDGEDLAGRVARAGPLDWRAAARVGCDLASGLAEIHAAGVVHRDVKPENVLLGPQGRPKLVDFGVARQLDRETRLTQTGGVLGSPLYLPPEAITGQRGDERALDVYGLGVVLHVALTGLVPHEQAGDTAGFELLSRRAQVPAPDVRRLQAEVPAGLARLLGRLLAVVPERRPCASAAAEELEALLTAPAVAQGRRRGVAPAIALVVGGLAVSLVMVGQTRPSEGAASQPPASTSPSTPPTSTPAAIPPPLAETPQVVAPAASSVSDEELARAALLLRHDPAQAQARLVELATHGPPHVDAYAQMLLTGLVALRPEVPAEQVTLLLDASLETPGLEDHPALREHVRGWFSFIQICHGLRKALNQVESGAKESAWEFLALADPGVARDALDLLHAQTVLDRWNQFGATKHQAGLASLAAARARSGTALGMLFAPDLEAMALVADELQLPKLGLTRALLRARRTQGAVLELSPWFRARIRGWRVGNGRQRLGDWQEDDAGRLSWRGGSAALDPGGRLKGLVMMLGEPLRAGELIVSVGDSVLTLDGVQARVGEGAEHAFPWGVGQPLLILPRGRDRLVLRLMSQRGGTLSLDTERRDALGSARMSLRAEGEVVLSQVSFAPRLRWRNGIRRLLERRLEAR